MTKTEAIKKKYEKILKNLNDSITGVEAQLAQAEKDLAEAKESEKQAVLSGDADVYLRSKAKQHEAAGAIELYTKRLEYIQEQPIIDQVEYDEAIKAVQDEFAEEQAKADEKLLDLAEQMFAIADELEQKGKDGTNVLNFLYVDVLRKKDGIPVSQLHPFYTPKLPFNNVIEYGKDRAKHYHYEKQRGRKEQPVQKLAFE